MEKKILSWTMLAVVSQVEAHAPVPAATANVSAAVTAPVTFLRTTGNMSFGNTAPSGTAGVVKPAPGATRRIAFYLERSTINAVIVAVPGESG
ncbi:hypothetical protein SAMN04488128_108163 [Chitinophaga eiseniae]|uniref:Uncharacterized protein n=2 Tax=Chitinophaga eiseniae TaxID=634771 RepID=A0A1T4U3Y1_9BACT|nr:hypothetical protein SAMN04488128_108163 [Chitinophaga eiseniae]